MVDVIVFVRGLEDRVLDGLDGRMVDRDSRIMVSYVVTSVTYWRFDCDVLKRLVCNYSNI